MCASLTGGSMPAQPDSQVVLLMVTIMDAGINAFGSQLESPLSGRDFVLGKEFLHVVPGLGIAESPCGPNDVQPAGHGYFLLHLRPMRLHPRPRHSLVLTNNEDACDQVGSILVADLVGDSYIQPALHQFRAAETGERVSNVAKLFR